MSITDFMTDEQPELNKGKINYPLSKVAANEWKGFALYTVEARAIPSMIDGLKPSQRFYLYSSILNTPKDFKKVESVAGVITDYGYNHGTGSAAGAGQLMAAEWNNNICLVQGRGSFGTRLVQQAAATRYTQSRLHPNFHKYIKDIDLAPTHEDPEHEPPAFYVPIIPLVLANGVKGIATGFATSILPRDPIGLAKSCAEYIKTGKISSRPEVKFPEFTGKTIFNKDEGRYYCYGTFERKGKTVLLIDEVPYGFDRESYIKILDDLEEKDDIVSYEDLCDDNGFRFEVKLKQNTSANWSDDEIIKNFKLCKTHTENITVIDENGKLREYEDALDLIKDFCEYRKGILQKRIDLNKEKESERMRWLLVKMQFIQAVLDNKIIFKNMKKEEVGKQILSETSALEKDITRLLQINIMSLTLELVKELQVEIDQAKEMYDYWSKTTVAEQFIGDLKEL